MSRIVCGALVVMLVAGCSDSKAKLKDAGLSYPQWDAMDKLGSEDVMRPLAMPASMNDWAGVKAGAKNAAFKAAVDEFAATAVPEEFATVERTTMKDEAAANFKALIEAAEKNEANDKIEKAYNDAIESFSKVRQPDPES